MIHQSTSGDPEVPEPDPLPYGPRPLWDPEAIPAATLIPLRDGPAGLELLMLRRDTRLHFAGGMWVFPGGRIDPEDYPNQPAGPMPTEEELEAAARVAVARELAEEAGIAIEATTVRRWSQWTPPPNSDRTADLVRHRFTTAFFVGVAVGDTDAVVIDHGEIRDHRWVRPRDMLDQHAAGEVALAPPTFITLEHIAPLRSPAEVLAGSPGGRNGPAEVEHFSTRVGATEDGWAALYHGDAGYDSGDITMAGPRHRLWMDELPWRYERQVR
ncbi:MAG: NUDIX domain-containing protein [Microthrixaceae bacterium]|nr:NUDIX domain-containing protein [Microthrixaceae bacterium]